MFTWDGIDAELKEVSLGCISTKNMLLVQVAHDGQEVFFLLQIPGAYAYNNE